MSKIGFVLGGVMLSYMIFFFDKTIQSGAKSHLTSRETSETRPSESSIKAYADTVNELLENAEKRSSLNYIKGDYSFQISKYTYKGKPILYIENGDSRAQGKVEKRYYIKNNHLALYSEQSITIQKTRPYITTNAFFKNNELFYAEQKSAENDSVLKIASFHKADLERKDQFYEIATLEDAIQQRGKFDLVFTGITEYPKAKYIILSQEGLNPYRAPIRVQNEDEFIHELTTNTFRYIGEKLDLSWLNNDTNEVIYRSGRLVK